MHKVLAAGVGAIALVAWMATPPSAGTVAEPPFLTEFAVPDYSPLARQVGAEGEVKARIELDSECRIVAVRLKEEDTRGHVLLRGAVKAAIKEWHFASCGGTPATVSTTFRFVLFGERTPEWTPTIVTVDNPTMFEIKTSPYESYP